MTPRMGVLAVVAMVLAGITAMRSSIPELLVEKDEVNDVQSNAIPNILSNSVEPMRDGSCRMQFHYEKRGRCLKLGSSSYGCVVGSFIQPLHDECSDLAFAR